MASKVDVLDRLEKGSNFTNESPGRQNRFSSADTAPQEDINDGDYVNTSNLLENEFRTNDERIFQLQKSDKDSAQEARSRSLMQRIGKIKERISMSSLNYSQEEHNMRSKSMPFPMMNQPEKERKDEEPSLSVPPSQLSSVGNSPLNTSTASAATQLLDASESFQSFSTIAGANHPLLDVTKLSHEQDELSEHVDISGISCRSTMTPNPPTNTTSSCQTPSPKPRNDTPHNHEYYYYEQRANVVEKLRGAAFKRRMDVSRSRDSLLAKERRQREQKLVIMQQLPVETVLQSDEKPTTSQFKALPLPKTTGSEGSCGLFGVPAVRKKGVTKPQSPCLGQRRKQKTLASEVKTTTAKLLPPVREGGLAGVPRVFKKPTTVPRSPLLGSRRTQSVQPTKSRSTALPRRKSVESTSSGSSGSLLGLAICTTNNKENPPTLETPTAARKSIQPFIPHSTKRAAERSAYEIRRAEYEQRRRENEQRERQVLIKRLERDIEKIRLKL